MRNKEESKQRRINPFLKEAQVLKCHPYNPTAITIAILRL
jgi:hypothetical protein